MKIKATLLKTAGGFVAALALALILPVMAHAAGKVTVIAELGANIRSSASTSGTLVASVNKNTVLDVISTEEAGGYTWYKVQVDANTVG